MYDNKRNSGSVSPDAPPARGSVASNFGPQSESSFFSGRSSGSRGSPKGALANTMPMRIREQQEWLDAERDKEMYLKRMRAQVPAAGEQDSLRELPDLQNSSRRKPPSDPGYSDRSYERRGGKPQGHGQVGQVADSQSHSSGRSGRSKGSGFSFSSFRSAISDIRNYSRRDKKDKRGSHGAGGSRGSQSPRRDYDSYSEDLPPREHDRYVDRGSPRDYERRGSPRDYDRGYERSSPRDYDRDRGSPRDYDRHVLDMERGYEKSSPREYDRGYDRGSPRDYDRGYDRGSPRDYDRDRGYESSSHGSSSRGYDRGYDRRHHRDYDRDRGYRSSPRDYDRGPPRDSPHDREPLSIKDRELMALRDRDDNSSYRGSSYRSASRRSLSRGGSVGAEARVIPATIRHARHGPGMMRRNTRDAMDNSSQGSAKGRRLRDEFDDGERELFERDDLVTNDLEAKLRTAQRNLESVKQELEEQKEEQERIKQQMKKKDMPGGSVVQHQLMQDLIALREHCMEIERKKDAEEAIAKSLQQDLRKEQDQRKEARQKWEESESAQKELQEQIEKLGKLAKDQEKKESTSKKVTDEIKANLEMITSERDETLELLRRAVSQKERLKVDKQRDFQTANEKIEKIQEQQKLADDKVRALLSNVDNLLGKFSQERDGGSSSTSGTQLQLELMKIRDHVRHLVTANEETRSQIQSTTSIKRVDTGRKLAS